MKTKSPPWFKPLIKRFLHFSRIDLDFLQSLVSDQDIIRLPVINPNYLINDPSAIHHIFLTHFDNYTKAGSSFERVEEVVGKGLLTNSGEDWAKRRQQLQPKFYVKNLNNAITLIQSCTQQMLERWQHTINSPFNLNEEMLSLVMNISALVLLGINVSDHSHELVKLIHVLNDYAAQGISFASWFPSFRNIRYQAAKKNIDEFLREALKNNGKNFSPTPLLSELFDGMQLTEQERLDEVKNFFLAGHETTGNALSWTFYCLAKNSYSLLQVLDEIDQVLRKDYPDENNIENLNYLEMVINEALRMYPPIWIITRRALQEDTFLNYSIPANAVINISPYLIHRHTKYWQNPESFFPERFLPEAAKNRPKCTYIPFGFGPRVCIGKQLAMMSMKIIIAMILQRYKVYLPDPKYKVEPLPLITLKPQNGMWLDMKKR